MAAFFLGCLNGRMPLQRAHVAFAGGSSTYPGIIAVSSFDSDSKCRRLSTSRSVSFSSAGPSSAGRAN
ncbi:MAG: hypothetical protein DWH78_01525 [Planctomycetota bacterium]|nr:MAG: hypothetical protein DWH78_01525 [Planctomycetota bacterium]